MLVDSDHLLIEFLCLILDFKFNNIVTHELE